jgi:hypothetical protein
MAFRLAACACFLPAPKVTKVSVLNLSRNRLGSGSSFESEIARSTTEPSNISRPPSDMGNSGFICGPKLAATAESLRLAAVEAQERSITVILQLVNPPASSDRLGGEHGDLRRNEPRNWGRLVGHGGSNRRSNPGSRVGCFTETLAAAILGNAFGCKRVYLLRRMYGRLR